MTQPSSAKSVKQSQVEMTELVLPHHTNQLGTIFGGQVMAWIDIAAAIAATRHTRTVCVTASIDALHFVAPVPVGHIVRLLASVNYAGNTSMEIGVRLDSEDPTSGDQSHVATAYLTFVSLDSNRRPKKIPPILPETEEERRRYTQAQVRRNSRLERKSGTKK